MEANWLVTLWSSPVHSTVMAMFRSKPFKASFDPAYDDLDLVEARDEIVQGRWEPARDMLEESRDFDRRVQRVRVLADAVGTNPWIERWQALDPHNRDAAVIRAQVEVVRAVRTHAQPGAPGLARQTKVAEEQCQRAIALDARDPTPWISLLTLARVQGVSRDEFWRRWQELRDRDEWSREGNNQALIYLFAAWQGSHAEMYDFAYWLAGQAPNGSPLATLPLVAHAEAYRVRAVEAKAAGSQIGLDLHWTQDQVQSDLSGIMTRWFRVSRPNHAQAKLDLNYLAHALVYADRHAEAAEVFTVIGAYATKLPWVYTGDPEQAFGYWRERLIGS
jgi:hypothetical protein